MTHHSLRIVLGLVSCCIAASGAIAQPDGYFVVCDPASGQVMCSSELSVARRVVMSELLPGKTTAEIWIEENCPSRHCDSDGHCAAAEAVIDPTGWYVLCNTGSGDIALVHGAKPPGFSFINGPHPSEKAAEGWVEEHCTAWSCGHQGDCKGGSSPGEHSSWVVGPLRDENGRTDASAEHQSSEGWAVGELSSSSSGRGVTADGAGHRPSPPSSRPDVSPLIDAAHQCVQACVYTTALANADQMAKYDPKNPWLKANHDRLRQLATRQKQTEQSLILASAQIDRGKYKKARHTIERAASSAVACQAEAVGVLLHRIDDLIAYDKERKQQRNARIADELMAGLFVLNQAVTAKRAAQPYNVPAIGGGNAGSSVATVSGGNSDPCAYNYSYPNVWTTEPVCGCAGYTYAPEQLRCVK